MHGGVCISAVPELLVLFLSGEKVQKPQNLLLKNSKAASYKPSRHNRPSPNTTKANQGHVMHGGVVFPPSWNFLVLFLSGEKVQKPQKLSQYKTSKLRGGTSHKPSRHNCRSHSTTKAKSAGARRVVFPLRMNFLILFLSREKVQKR